MALELGRPVGELIVGVTAAELDLWRLFRNRKGFPSDRVIDGIAIGASYCGGVWGGKAKPNELVAKYRTRGLQVSATKMANWLRQLPGVKVRDYGRLCEGERPD